MKKALFAAWAVGLLVLSACDIAEFGQKEPVETPSKDAELTGEKVDVSAIPAGVKKVFVLNEGGMGTNNATLDFLRISDGNYITGAFKKMNDSGFSGSSLIPVNLGDVGNDIAVHGDEIWIVVNNSGIVEVLSAKDETEIATIAVPTPRNVAFDGNYAYVTSWAGAYANGNYDNGYYAITDYKNPKGQVYRINLTTRKVEGSIEVGYQPEGIAYQGGKLYVANSGGIASQLPPDYAYDKTVSIIDAQSFKVTKTVEVQVNLKNVYADGAGNVYVTCLGDYWSTHSGLYMIDGSDAVKHVADYVSVSAIKDGTVYCIGTEDEFDWSGAPKTWKAWSCRSGAKTGLSWSVDATTPYGLFAFDANTYLLGDAGDYFNPGTVSLYSGGKRWAVTAGVCPGHFAIW